jgi:hypothetical protein
VPNVHVRHEEEELRLRPAIIDHSKQLAQGRLREAGGPVCEELRADAKVVKVRFPARMFAVHAVCASHAEPQQLTTRREGCALIAENSSAGLNSVCDRRHLSTRNAILKKQCTRMQSSDADFGISCIPETRACMLPSWTNRTSPRVVRARTSESACRAAINVTFVG